MGEEKAFETRIKRYLESKGCWHVKFFANRMTKIGVPDILACVNGRFVGIEVKATHGRANELQVYQRDGIRGSGGVSVIVYPEQFDALKAMIERMIDGENPIEIVEQFDFDKI